MFERTNVHCGCSEGDKNPFIQEVQSLAPPGLSNDSEIIQP